MSAISSQYALPLASSKSVIDRSSVLALGIVLAVILAIAIYVSFPIAGVIYGCFFCLLSWFRPVLAFVVIFGAAPFVWDVGGGPVKMAVADISLILAFPLLTLRRMMKNRPLAHNPL